MNMKTLTIVIIVIFAGVFASCKSTDAASSSVIAGKVGAQLWSENCTRCHNAPSPTDYSDQQWDIIGTHMQVRAQLTDVEQKKIIEFLQTAN